MFGCSWLIQIKFDNFTKKNISEKDHNEIKKKSLRVLILDYT